jgi:hypothetical protein
LAKVWRGDCNRQRPFFVAGERHGFPLLVRTPHSQALQLLDRITAGQKPKPPDEKKFDPYREMFDETRECSFKLP